MVALQLLGVQTARGQNTPSPKELVQNNAIQPIATPQHRLQVTDEFGDALAGATVIFRAADSTYLGGTATDAGGYATVPIIGVERVEVSYIGYKSILESLDSEDKPQSITLISVSETLETAVVSAYAIEIFGGYNSGMPYKQFQWGRIDTLTTRPHAIVYPNPSRGNLHVRTQRPKTTPQLTNVYGLNGALVYSQLANTSATLQKLRLPYALAAGTYVLEVIYDDGTTDASQFVLAR